MKYLKKFTSESELPLIRAIPNVVSISGSRDVYYNYPPPSGAYIQHINGNIYTKTEWIEGEFNKDEANGIAIIDENCSFVMHKSIISSTIPWSSDSNFTIVNGVMCTTSETIAKTDYSGYQNTNIILDLENPESKTGAIYICSHFKFPNGKIGYLPSLGELITASKYSSDANQLATLIGGGGFRNVTSCWSSTQYDDEEAWACYLNSGKVWADDKKNTISPNHVYSYIPFTKLKI